MQVRGSRIAIAAFAVALALAPRIAAAQDGQFDLRPRATPTASAPPVVGPTDPDNPYATRPQPRATPAPQPSAPPLTVPSAAPQTASPTQAAPSPAQRAARPVAAPRVPQATSTAAPLPAVDASTPPAPPSATLPATGPAPSPSAAPVQPRNLDLVPESKGIGLWLAVGLLVLVVGVGGWLVWSRYLRFQPRSLPAPEIERPRLPVAPVPTGGTADVPAEPAPPAPAPAPAPALQDLDLVLEATRLSATLMNTALSYRLAITNRTAQRLSDVRIDGDMIAAHASRPMEPVIGRNAAVLPPLHHIKHLAPGETVTLGGDIRLPLVAITPIRKGNAAFFVPLARLRARGTAGTGITVEGGGTYLVGQEPGANQKLQPFRLDLGPRNYSNLGQQLLSAA